MWNSYRDKDDKYKAQNKNGGININDNLIYNYLLFQLL